MRTADVERRTGYPRSTLRLYERKGLIAPGRTAQGYRLYSAADLERLEEIRIGQALGFTLAELKTLMGERARSAPDPQADLEIVTRRLDACEAELARLTRLRDYLASVRLWLKGGRSGPKPEFDLQTGTR